VRDVGKAKEVDGEDDRENRAVPRAPKAAAEELGPARQASHFVAARTNSSRRDARTAANSLMVAIGLQKKGTWIGIDR
jgi:hypothetical protein